MAREVRRETNRPSIISVIVPYMHFSSHSFVFPLLYMTAGRMVL